MPENTIYTPRMKGIGPLEIDACGSRYLLVLVAHWGAGRKLQVYVPQ